MLPNPLEEIARKLDEYNKRLSHLERLEGAGTLIRIEEIDLSIAAANMDFTNISTDYRHLFLTWMGRSTSIVGSDNVRLRFNGDVGNNYDTRRIANGAISDTQSAQSSILAHVCNDASVNADKWSMFSVWILYYQEIQDKLYMNDGVRSSADGGANLIREIIIGLWRDVSVINQITLFPLNGPNWQANSRAILYGVL